MILESSRFALKGDAHAKKPIHHIKPFYKFVRMIKGNNEIRTSR